MQSNLLVAANIRRFRRERDLSLGDLAKRTGLSKQTLSKIESGEGNPTIGTLEQLCQGLGVSLTSVLATYGSNVRLLRVTEREKKKRPVGTEVSLDRVYGTGYVETGLYEVYPGEPAPIEPHTRGTLHQVYVISGRVIVGGELESVELSPGDFFRFPGDIEHYYQAVDSEVLLHITTTAPQVAQFKPLR